MLGQAPVASQDRGRSFFRAHRGPRAGAARGSARPATSPRCTASRNNGRPARSRRRRPARCACGATAPPPAPRRGTAAIASDRWPRPGGAPSRPPGAAAIVARPRRRSPCRPGRPGGRSDSRRVEATEPRAVLHDRRRARSHRPPARPGASPPGSPAIATAIAGCSASSRSGSAARPASRSARYSSRTRATSASSEAEASTPSLIESSSRLMTGPSTTGSGGPSRASRARASRRAIAPSARRSRRRGCAPGYAG